MASPTSGTSVRAAAAYRLAVTGMDNSGSPHPVRQRWQRADGAEQLLEFLRDAGAPQGDYTLAFASQAKSRGHTPRVDIRQLDPRRGIRLRSRPGDSSTCLEGYLSLRGGNNEAVYEALVRHADRVEDQLDSPAAPLSTPPREALTEAKTAQLAVEEPSAIVTAASHETKSLLDAAVQLRELQAQRCSKEEQLAGLQKDIDDLRRRERQVLGGLDTAPLYKAIELLEKLAAEAGVNAKA
jgi:hypothetical protein